MDEQQKPLDRHMYEEKLLSKCCESEVNFFPPSLGEPGFYYCSKCTSQCETELKIVQISEKIAPGIYRPIKKTE